IGVTLTSAETFSNTWQQLRIEALAPVGARSVELRAMARRADNNPWGLPAGVDDLAARLVYADVPTVTVEATDGSASEAGGDLAIFTIRRSAADPMLNRDVTVRYTLGGSATPGSDYEAPSGSVTLHAGETSATVTVRPLSDNAIEG